MVDFLDERRRPLESGLRKAGPYPYYGASGIIDYVNDYIFDEELILLSEDGANIIDRNYRVCFMARGKYWVNNHAHVLKAKNNYYNEFICEALERLDYTKYNTGTAQPKLNQEVCRNINILIPNLDEQIQISTFFINLDYLITLHQRKLTLLQKIKEGFLQAMFPEKGKSVPKLRFADFDRKWEQRKLGEMTDIYDGTHQTPAYKDKGIMFLSVENIKTLQSEKYISEEDFKKEFKVRPEKDDVLMTRIGNIGTANVIKSDEHIAYYVSLALLKKKDLNPYFLQASIHTPYIQEEIWKRTLHIAFPKKINKNEIAKVSISFPRGQEQEQVGDFFANFDHLITLHQSKLEKLQTLKKSYLQRMFI